MSLPSPPLSSLDLARLTPSLATNSAHDVATDRNNKTIAASHVLEAVKQLGWEDDQELIKHLKDELAGASLLSLQLP